MTHYTKDSTFILLLYGQRKPDSLSGHHGRRYPLSRQSPTRQRILDFIGDFKDRHDYTPTIREIARHCRITSTSVVHYHLTRLEQEGLITRSPDTFRSIVLSRKSRNPSQVPLLGVIAAGQPLWVPPAGTWTTWTERSVDVPGEILKGKKAVYALEVKGNSMVDAMIGDGDIVIMEQTGDIRNGDVAACWLKNEQEVTLKKVYFEGETVRLQPCNPYMAPIFQEARNVEIQGKCIAVIRINP